MINPFLYLSVFHTHTHTHTTHPHTLLNTPPHTHTLAHTCTHTHIPAHTVVHEVVCTSIHWHIIPGNILHKAHTHTPRHKGHTPVYYQHAKTCAHAHTDGMQCLFSYVNVICAPYINGRFQWVLLQISGNNRQTLINLKWWKERRICIIITFLSSCLQSSLVVKTACMVIKLYWPARSHTQEVEQSIDIKVPSSYCDLNSPKGQSAFLWARLLLNRCMQSLLLSLFRVSMN